MTISDSRWASSAHVPMNTNPQSGFTLIELLIAPSL
ncbi:hypothetical protein DHC84_02870 [Pseudomonas sp. G11-2]|nr:hypothetical protein [Pseudomonas sp. G11-2]